MDNFKLVYLGKGKGFWVVLDADDIPIADLADQRYELQVDSNSIGAIVRAANGKYISVMPLSFQPSKSFHNCKLVGSSGSLEFGVNLLPREKHVSFFSAADGERFCEKHGPRDTNKRWLVVHDDKVTFTPRLSFESDSGGELRFGILEEDWDKTTIAELESKTIWKASETESSKKKQITDWRYAVKAELDKSPSVAGKRSQVKYPAVGERVDVTIINLPKYAALARVSIDGEALNFEQRSFGALVKDCPIDERASAEGLPLDLEIAIEETTHCLTTLLVCEIKAANLIFPDGRKVKLSADRSVRVQYVREAKLQLILPKFTAKERKDLALFQGHEIIGKLPTRARSWPQLKGTGAPLVLKPAFNSEGGIVLSGSVRDLGHVSALVPNGTRCFIKLTRPIEVSEEHSVVVWNTDKRQVSIDDKVSSKNGMIETANVPGASYGLAYRGAWIGGNAEVALASLVTQQSLSLEELALIRWFHCPVLSPGFENKLEVLVNRAVPTTIAAWIFGQGLPFGLRFDSGDRSVWITVLRSMLFFWQPSQDELLKVIAILEAGYSTRLAAETQIPLLVQDMVPHLTRDIACLWERNLEGKVNSNLFDKWLVALIGNEKLENIKSKLTKEVRRSMDVDEDFIESIIKSANSLTSSRNTLVLQNVRTAVGYASFRKLLAVNQLSKISAKQRGI